MSAATLAPYTGDLPSRLLAVLDAEDDPLYINADVDPLGLGRELTDEELDARLWGFLYGLAYGIARGEDAFEPTPSVAARAGHAAMTAMRTLTRSESQTARTVRHEC